MKSQVMRSSGGALALMSTARIVMKKAKKNAAEYSAKASAASNATLTRRMFDIEKVSSASHKPAILIMQTA